MIQASLANMRLHQKSVVSMEGPKADDPPLQFLSLMGHEKVQKVVSLTDALLFLLKRLHFRSQQLQ